MNMLFRAEARPTRVSRGFILLILGLQVHLLLPRAATAGDTIVVPIRWCVMKGSPAARSPMIDGKTVFPDGSSITTDNVLWNRHERITDHVYNDNRALTDAEDPRITFRSAFEAEIRDSPTRNFPVLDDLDLDSNGVPIAGTQGSGDEGDVLDADADTSSPPEYIRRLQACDRKWSELKDTAGNPIKIDWGKGVTVLNVNAFRDSKGGRRPFRGFGGSNDKNLSHPFAVVTDLSYASAHVNTDNPRVVSFDTLLAHEMGHALSLPHLSTGEDSTKTNVMCNGSLTTPPHSCRDQVDFNKAQSDLLRAFAMKIGNLDPPAAILSGPLVADLKTDGLNEVTAAAVDLAELRVEEDTTRDITSFTHVLPGLLPLTAKDLRYWTLADLDNDPATGARSADLAPLGVPSTLFEGVDIVVMAEISSSGGGLDATAKLWKFDPGLGTLSPVSEPSLRAITGRTLLFDASPAGDVMPLFDVVRVELSNQIRGPLPCPFRVHALTEFSSGTVSIVDRLEESSPGAGFSACLVPRTDFPLCEVRPPIALPGAPVEVVAQGLLASSPAHTIFVEQWVGSTATDSFGNYALSFYVPPDARPGVHLVTVGSKGTALTADCLMEVADFPDCNSNQIDDAVDIAQGTSQDLDASGVPDECEIGSAVCLLRGTAAGGQVALTITGFFATCNVAVTTTSGQTAAEVAAALTAAINGSGCLAAQGISASAVGSTLTVRGFRLGPEDLVATSSDPGISHEFALIIPTLSTPMLIVWGLLLMVTGILSLYRRNSETRGVRRA